MSNNNSNKKFKIVIDMHLDTTDKVRITLEGLLFILCQKRLDGSYFRLNKKSFEKVEEEQYSRLEMELETSANIRGGNLQRHLFSKIPSHYFSANYPEAVTVEEIEN